MAGARVSIATRWEREGVLVVDVAGVLDGDGAGLLCGLLTRMLRTGQRAFVVNFEGADDCGADVARRFAEANLAAAEGGGVLAVVAGAAVRRALRAAGADRFAGGVHDTVADAVEGCRAGGVTRLGGPAS